jgi:hypothetical protein
MIVFRPPDNSLAAGTLRLNGRTLHRAVGTEHTTVTGFRAHQRLTAVAFIEELARIRAHGFLFGKTTARTSQHRFKRNGGESHGFELLGVAGKPRPSLL